MWCTPAPPRPSGSSIRNTKLLVPSGVPVQENWGDTFSPTQLGLFPAFLLAAALGSMVPSLKVEDDSMNTSAADACAVHSEAIAMPPARTRADLTIITLPPYEL